MPTKPILVVDDDGPTRAQLRRTLEEAGHTVVEAANGREALGLYDPEAIGLVVTDVFMPELDGLATIMALRKIDPAVKIIAISGPTPRLLETFLDTARVLGAVRTLEKPVDPFELIGAVQGVLAGGTPPRRG